MYTLLLLALATFITWEFISSIVPFRIPARIQPLIVAAMAYGMWHVPTHWLFPLAVAGGVAILHRFLAGGQEPADWSRLKDLTKRQGKRKSNPNVGIRIPQL